MSNVQTLPIFLTINTPHLSSINGSERNLYESQINADRMKYLQDTDGSWNHPTVDMMIITMVKVDIAIEAYEQKGVLEQTKN